MKTFLLLPLILAFSACDFSSDYTSTIELDPSVVFTGTQFVITNNDPFDYTNTTLRVNDKYSYSAGTLEAGQTYSIGMMQFADSRGNRLLPTIKPLNFSVVATALGEQNYAFLSFN